MYIQILFGAGVLVVGAVLSRIIQNLQLNRLESEKRAELFKVTQRLRSFALIPALVAVMLFIIGIVMIPQSFAQLVRIMTLCSIVYVALLNVLVFIGYLRARCGVVFVIVALIAKGIVFAALFVFCYLVITALQ